MLHIWLLPALLIGVTIAMSMVVGRYLAWIMDGKYRPPRLLAWFERRLNMGAQSWVQYTIALLLFNLVMFVVGYVLLVLQPWLWLNPDGMKMLAPTTSFN